MQAEVISQEFLAIAPAELEIVLAKLLIEEPAERIEQTAGEIGLGGLVGRGGLRLSARRRDEMAAIDLGISGGNKV